MSCGLKSTTFGTETFPIKYDSTLRSKFLQRLPSMVVPCAEAIYSFATPPTLGPASLRRPRPDDATFSKDDDVPRAVRINYSRFLDYGRNGPQTTTAVLSEAN